jgi:TonB family protein
MTSVPDFVPVERQPVPVDQVQPVYPADARRDSVEGRITMRVHVRADGTVGGLQILRVSLERRGEALPDRNPYEAAFVQAATDAIRQWRFEPARQNGQPVAVMMTLPIRFRQRPSPPRTPEQEAQSQRKLDSLQTAADAMRRHWAWLEERGSDVFNGRIAPAEVDRPSLLFHIAYFSRPLSPEISGRMRPEEVQRYEIASRRFRERAEAALRRLDGR